MARKKQPQQNQSKALVKTPPKGKGTSRKQSGGDATYAQAYKAALMNPFSSTALGARVPDMYSAPTVSKHYTQSYSVTTGSGSVGATFLVLPNLYMPCIVTAGSFNSGTVPWQTMDGVTGANQTAVIVPTSSISSQLTNYRIVGYGVRIYSTGSITNTTGRVIVATSPVSSWVNYKAATIGGQATSSNNANASNQNTLLSYGIPALGGMVQNDQLPSMQNCFETSLIALATNPMVVTPKVNSPEAFEFRQSADSAIGFQINNQTSATFVSSGDASYLRVAGHELVCVSVVGANAGVGVLQVEIVYHVEGTPAYSTLTSDTPTVIAAPTTMSEIVAAAARSEPFKMGLETAGNALLPGLGTFARAIL